MKNGIIFTDTDELSDVEEDFDFGFTPLSDGSFSATAFEADGELLEYPASFRDRPVTRIESYYEGIVGGEGVTKLVIPEGIRVIGYQGLSFLYSLKEMKLPESLLKLEKLALDGCTSLLEIDMPSRLQAIFELAFSDCKSLTRVGLNEGLVAIGDEAFYCCESLTELEIPRTVELVGINPFVGCRSLSEIRVAADNPHFKAEDGALYTRDGRILLSYPAAKEGERFVIPDGVREIAPKAFAETVYLREVYIPDSVEIIDEHAFFFCSGIERVVMPRDMAYLHREAFFASDRLRIEKY